MGTSGFTVWFTGLSGSGKTTLAELLEVQLRRRGLKVELLAGSEFRQNLSQGLGFSREDRIANVRRIGYVAKLLTRNGVAVLASAVSPYREARDECRRTIGRFVEVFVDCPLPVCESRDGEGLYLGARLGTIQDVAGVTDPYEPPLHPEVVCRTDRETPEAGVRRILEYLESAGYVPPAGALSVEEDLIKSQLRLLDA